MLELDYGVGRRHGFRKIKGYLNRRVDEESFSRHALLLFSAFSTSVRVIIVETIETLISRCGAYCCSRPCWLLFASAAR
jgi:hypothetical protein